MLQYEYLLSIDFVKLAEFILGISKLCVAQKNKKNSIAYLKYVSYAENSGLKTITKKGVLRRWF